MRFFRKFRQQVFTENKFGKYLLYVLGEIIIVVIGILIALQINNWNMNRIDRQKEVKVYRDIKRQINDDLNELREVAAFNEHFLKQYEMANGFITANNRNAVDTLAYFTMMLSQFSDFHRTGNIFETLVNSGDIKLLKNDSIPGKLQQLEMTYHFINRLEDIHWELIITELPSVISGVINYTTFEIIRPDQLYSVELQNFFFECIHLMQNKKDVYNQALSEIESITTVIDAELGIETKEDTATDGSG